MVSVFCSKCGSLCSPQVLIEGCSILSNITTPPYCRPTNYNMYRLSFIGAVFPHRYHWALILLQWILHCSVSVIRSLCSERCTQGGVVHGQLQRFRRPPCCEQQAPHLQSALLSKNLPDAVQQVRRELRVPPILPGSKLLYRQ